MQGEGGSLKQIVGSSEEVGSDDEESRPPLSRLEKFQDNLERSRTVKWTNKGLFHEDEREDCNEGLEDKKSTKEPRESNRNKQGAPIGSKTMESELEHSKHEVENGGTKPSEIRHAKSDNMPIKYLKKEDFGRVVTHLKNISCVVGMHPDQATGAIVDFALSRRICFAVVQCFFPLCFSPL